MIIVATAPLLTAPALFASSRPPRPLSGTAMICSSVKLCAAWVFP